MTPFDSALLVTLRDACLCAGSRKLQVSYLSAFMRALSAATIQGREAAL